ncbi:MAG: type II secretion system minor pseudopilin GspK [Smithella sp.]
MKKTFFNPRHKPLSDLRKKFFRIAASIISPLSRDCSTYQFPSKMPFRVGTSFRKLLFHNNKGIALITVILIVAILVAVAIELNRSSRAEIYDTANLSDGIKLTYIAKSGFYGAAALLTNSQNDYDTLRDEWARMEQISMQSNTLFPEGYFIARIEDEDGKIPLNKLANGDNYNPAVKEILTRLLNQPEFKLDERKVAEIVDSIKDWIDSDDISSDYGAESSYYSSLDYPYKAKNAPFDCIEELLMVKGVTKEIFYGTKEKPSLAAFVTADSDGVININTAPKMVLRSLSDGISPELADSIDEYRTKGENDLSSYQWYKNVSGMEAVTIAPEILTVKSNYFKIISTGKMNNMAKAISGVVKRTDRKSVKIIKWRLY